MQLLALTQRRWIAVHATGESDDMGGICVELTIYSVLVLRESPRGEDSVTLLKQSNSPMVYSFFELISRSVQAVAVFLSGVLDQNYHNNT